MQGKTFLLHELVCFQNFFSSEEAVSHNVLHYQQLSIAHNQVSFYAKVGVVTKRVDTIGNYSK